jgi:hypothetical protein
MSVRVTGRKESPDFNLQYRYTEAVAAADDPRYVADVLVAFYGTHLDPLVAVDIDLAARAECTFREWRPGRGLRRWQPSELVDALAARRRGNVSHASRSDGADRRGVSGGGVR